MTNENKKKNVFFNSYKAFMDYLMVVSDTPNEYGIYVLNRGVNKDTSNLSVSIYKNMYVNNRDYNIAYNNNITLSKDSINELVNAIRNDFIENHYITYASLNEEEMTQTIQNTRFSLVFKLNTYTDLLEAHETNRSINLKKEDTNKGKIRELGLK